MAISSFFLKLKHSMNARPGLYISNINIYYLCRYEIKMCMNSISVYHILNVDTLLLS